MNVSLLNMFKRTLEKLSRHEAQSITEALKQMLIRVNQDTFDQLVKRGISRTETFSE
ncbi:hypothetical protein IQA55_15160 [Leptospira borgpetersenii serovar Tarassovi]|nr:hypothetical protein [Leptospira borgpetersenii serovar Tarassovi]